MMISRTTVLAVVAGALASSASATVLPFSTSFEAAEGYVSGQQLATQGGGNWTGDGQDASGWQVTNSTIGGSGAKTGSQWVLASSPTATLSRFQWTVTPVTDFSVNPVIKGSSDVKLVNPTSGSVSRNTVAGIQMYTAAVALLAQIDLHIDTENVYGLGAGRMIVNLFYGDGTSNSYDLGVSNALNQYINLGLAVDFSSNTVTGYVNGVALPDVGSAGGYTDFHDFDLFDARGTTTTGGTGARAGFDNYSIAQIAPAPTSIALIGLAGLGASRRRR